MFNKFLFSILILLIISCKKFVEVGPPKTTITTSTAFADSTGATAAIKGIYIKMTGLSASLSAGNGLYTICAGLAADELQVTSSSGNYNTEAEFYINKINPLNTANYNFWATNYSLIYQANACVEGLQSSNSLSISCKNQLLGEALTLRGLFYLNLINSFGDVPLILTTNYDENASKARVRIDSILIQITKDLESAEVLLAPTYPSVGKVRINKFVAQSLMARVYLMQGKWNLAQETSSKILNSNLYFLEPNLDNVFLASSRESIWQLIPLQAGYETTEGFFFIPAAAQTIPKYILSLQLLNSFQPGDQRYAKWVKSVIVNNQNYSYPFKYKLGRDNNTTPLEHYVICRLSEQLLIRSEAKANLSDLAGALVDLNAVRSRAGLISLNLLTKDEVLKAILRERQIEFFCEGGHRWNDIKRMGKVDEIMNTVCSAKGGTWSTNWKLFPIPQTEINLNPFLSQNNGY